MARGFLLPRASSNGAQMNNPRLFSPSPRQTMTRRKILFTTFGEDNGGLLIPPFFPQRLIIRDEFANYCRGEDGPRTEG